MSQHKYAAISVLARPIWMRFWAKAKPSTRSL